jgi:hypothetical protein
MALLVLAIVVGLVLLILGLALNALKWLIIIAVVVWVVGAVRHYLARRSSSRT